MQPSGTSAAQASGLGVVASAAVLLVAIGAAGCRANQGTGLPQTAALEPGAKPADDTRFPHALHTGDSEAIRSYKNRGLACADCHPADAVLAGDYARPGTDEHSPCDECHEDEFSKPPGKFCSSCHTTVNARVSGETQLKPYPERGYRKVLAADFSHRMHLDRDKMDAAVGFHVACSDCHARDATSRDPLLPGHKQCAQCHAQKSRARESLNMGDCSNCHADRNQTLVRGRLFITGDLIFAHKTHEQDAAGKPIACDTCHTDIASSSSSAQVSLPPKKRCATCHEDASRTPDRVRIDNCQVCHTKIKAGRKPASHEIEQELPIDHTIEFRKNHDEQAAKSDAPCAFCHQELTGSKRDNCFGCHQTKRPRDHNLGWRDDTHGREAPADRERCATCHDADYCTACHSIAPRSHQPYLEFRVGGHARAARFDLRSCFACHTFQTTCSNCHRRRR